RQCGTTLRLQFSEAAIDARAHGDFTGESIGLTSAPALAHRRHTDIDGAQHQYHDGADELHPFLLLQHRTGREQPHAQEIGDIGGRYDNQNPADELLPADHRHDARNSSNLNEYATICGVEVTCGVT